MAAPSELHVIGPALAALKDGAAHARKPLYTIYLSPFGNVAMKINGIIYRATAVAAIFMLCLAGCAQESSVQEATQTADGFFQAVKSRDFDKAGEFFVDSPTQPRQLWVDQLRENNARLGDLESYALVSKLVNTVYSGARYTLKYKVKYSKHEAFETLILFGGVSGNPVQIEIMQVHSDGA